MGRDLQKEREKGCYSEKDWPKLRLMVKQKGWPKAIKRLRHWLMDLMKRRVKQKEMPKMKQKEMPKMKPIPTRIGLH